MRVLAPPATTQRARGLRPPVLHVAPALWSGAGAVITRLAEGQAAAGPVAIVTSGRRGPARDWPDYRRRLARAGVRHYRLDFLSRDSRTFAANTARLASLIDEIEPGVIHAHAGVPSLGSALARAASRTEARLIGQMYSWGPGRPEWMNLQDVWGLGQTDRVVCSAYGYRDLLLRYGVPRSRLVYLPWGLPLSQLPWRGTTPPARDGRGPAGPRIGFVGRIEPRKGQLPLVRAFARVRRQCPGATLHLIGPVADERYAAEVRAAIAGQELQAFVRMPGRVRDVVAELGTWDLFVSLSEDEGQGLAVLEAMAVGVPVATRLVAGISDFVVDRRTGIALASDAPSTVARTILGALGDPGLLRRVSRHARTLVERRYAWEKTAKAFSSLYWDER
jgi:glycosyltransferase involved in cell wall biosynthesis